MHYRNRQQAQPSATQGGMMDKKRIGRGTLRHRLTGGEGRFFVLKLMQIKRM
jgi:hypothetical protein